jgi:hypothetical protein
VPIQCQTRHGMCDGCRPAVPTQQAVLGQGAGVQKLRGVGMSQHGCRVWASLHCSAGCGFGTSGSQRRRQRPRHKALSAPPLNTPCFQTCNVSHLANMHITRCRHSAQQNTWLLSVNIAAFENSWSRKGPCENLTTTVENVAVRASCGMQLLQF